jgi:hypothetical protein
MLSRDYNYHRDLGWNPTRIRNAQALGEKFSSWASGLFNDS